MGLVARPNIVSTIETVWCFTYHK